MELTYTVYDVYELMPKKDCGSCGNPSCRTMARKIVTGDAKVEQCINLSSPEHRDRAEKIRRMLEEGVEHGAKGTIIVGEGGITYIHPCISEAGKVTADARLTAGPEGAVDLKYGFFDPIIMCWALKESGVFQDLRCSPKLGVARVNMNGKTVMVFQDGRMNVRRAKDKQDAVETVRLVSRVLWTSIICSCCGNAGIDCASGGCEDCLTRVCPVLAGGPPDPSGRSQGPSSQTNASTIFERAGKLETGRYFFEGTEHLDNAMKLLTEVGRGLAEGRFDKNSLDTVGRELDLSNQLAVRFVIETPRVQDATIGLILAGITLDMTRINVGLNTLIEGENPLPANVKQLLLDAVEIVEKAYRAYRAVSFETAQQAIKAYTDFRRNWGQLLKERPSERDELVAVEKIATNGFYIARLLTKPVPA